MVRPQKERLRMCFFNTIKRIVGATNVARVDVTSIAGKAPGRARFNIGDPVLHGSMRTVVQEDCTLLATTYQVILRSRADNGEWSDVMVAFGKDSEVRELMAGDEVATNFYVDNVDVARSLRQQGLNPNDAVGNDSVKLMLRCMAEIEDSPFAPAGEAELVLTPQAAMSVKITNIEGDAPDMSTFPVTETVLKGTVVVTANEEAVLAATKYEVLLRIDGEEVVVAQETGTELDPDAPGHNSASGPIELPLEMKPGKKATHSWKVRGINLADTLAKYGFADPSAAAHDDRVSLFVRCLADMAGRANAAMSETRVALQS